MVLEKEEAGVPVPFSEGILIFKVGAKIYYHAKTQKLVDLAMSADKLGSLHNVYQTLQPDHRTQKCSYIMQYLWRCSASSFNSPGPYYMCSASLKAKFIVATLFETTQALDMYVLIQKYAFAMGQVRIFLQSRCCRDLITAHMAANLLEVVRTSTKSRHGFSTLSPTKRCSLSSVLYIRYPKSIFIWCALFGKFMCVCRVPGLWQSLCTVTFELDSM